MSTLRAIKGHHKRGAGSFDQFNTINGSSTGGGGLIGDTQRQLVQYSVRAQEFILKKGLHNTSTLNVDDINLNIGKGPAEGMDSYLDESIGEIKQGKAKKGFLGTSMTPHGVFQLPQINEKNKSPFKGFLDISIAT